MQLYYTHTQNLAGPVTPCPKCRRLLDSSLIQPFCPFWSLTCMHIDCLFAFLTAHCTTPVEFTLAFGGSVNTSGVITSTTAHNFTAVCPSGDFVTHSSCSAQRTCRLVHQAVIRRILKVDKVLFCGFSEVLIGYCEASTILIHGDLDCPVVFPSEIVPCFSKI